VDGLAKAGVSKSTIGKISALVTVGAGAASSQAAPAAKPAAAPAPASAPASAPAAAVTTGAKPASADAGKPAASAATSQPRQAPPAKGMVWVNTSTRVYHYEGDQWYGNTKAGKYMTEDEAIKAGYRASKEKQKSK
jgi:hypothetical protein